MNHKICSCNKLPKFLLLIYFVCVIPVIAIYFIHGHQELEESKKLKEMGNQTKATKTLAEGGFLISAMLGYIIATFFVYANPTNKIPYLFILVGTVIIIIIFMARSEYGVPIPFTNLEITKYTVGWEGFWTKTLQSILLIPISMLLVLNTRNKKITSTK